MSDHLTVLGFRCTGCDSETFNTAEAALKHEQDEPNYGHEYELVKEYGQ
jgi:hypothetical protein